MVEYIEKETRSMFIKPLTIVIRLVGVNFLFMFTFCISQNFTREYKVPCSSGKKVFKSIKTNIILLLLTTYYRRNGVSKFSIKNSIFLCACNLS